MVRVGGTWWDGKLRGRVALLTVLLIGWSASPASAETLVFHNDYNAPVVLQVVSVFRGVFRRERPYLLHPGDHTKPAVTLIGDKVITILDAKAPNRVLYQGALPSSSFDRHFRIIPDEPPRVRLVPHQPPTP